MAKLQTLKKSKAKAALRKGARAGSKIVQAVAKRMAPKKTGQLQRKIKVRAIKRSRKWTGVNVQLEVFYGAFLELGTQEITALHYLQRASDQARDQAMRAALDVIQQEIENWQRM